jgi:hypothetical protein
MIEIYTFINIIPYGIPGIIPDITGIPVIPGIPPIYGG